MRHLYENALHYDRLFPGPNDLPFYRRVIAANPGPVLELACGTGRLTIPLAEQGIDIAGLDNSPAMLDLARANAAQHNLKIAFHQSDMRHYNLGRTFQVIFVPINSFSHLLTLHDIEACLRTTRKHLAPGGKFIIDIFTPSARMLASADLQEFKLGEYDDPTGPGRIIVTETRHYDVVAQINRGTWRYTNQQTHETWQHPFDLRMFYPQEIDALLHYNGFEIENKYGWYDESPYGDGAPKQLVVSRTA